MAVIYRSPVAKYNYLHLLLIVQNTINTSQDIT